MIPTRYISAGPMAAKAKPGAAMAGGMATAQVGQALAQAGEAGLEVVGRIRRMKEAGAINAFMSQADEAAGRFSIELAKRHDTEAWPEEWQNRTSELREQGQALGLSPEGMADFEQKFGNWSSTRAIHFETQAATKALGIAKAQTTQSLEYYASRGDREGFERTLATGTAGGILNPAEKQQAEMEFARQAAALDMERLVEGNPQGVVDMADEEFLKVMPGATLDMVRRGKDMAKAKVREGALDTVEAAQDEIVSGKITEPEQIDTNPRYAGLRPVVREKLKRALVEYQANQMFGLMNTPEAQAAVVGKVSGLLDGWEPKAAEDADLQYAEISGLIGQLPEGAMRSELARQAKAIRTGAWADSTSHADAAMKALDAAAKAGRFGKVPEPGKVTTLEVVQAGFLKDTVKLQRLGFSEKQANKIRDAAEDPAVGQKEFIELWKERDAGSVLASGPELEAANAVRLGHATVPWVRPEAEDAAIAAKLETEKKLGEAKMKLADFLRVNPKATASEIDGKILEIGGEQTVRELKSGIYDGKPAPPKAGGFVPGETSMNLPAGLSPLRTAFVEEGLRYGVDPRFLAAVSMHETAKGTSSAFRNKRNAMGVSNSSGPIAFDDERASIAKMARLLGSTTSGPYKHAATIAEIGRIYAPVGAANDPKSLNHHWAGGVAKYFKELGGNPSAMIKTL